MDNISQQNFGDYILNVNRLLFICNPEIGSLHLIFFSILLTAIIILRFHTICKLFTFLYMVHIGSLHLFCEHYTRIIEAC